jgi:superfamily I DNA/RNA helicase
VARTHTTAALVPLADLVGEVTRLTGIATELAASPDPESEVALRHLSKLRDLAQEYQPVTGGADLAGFVQYLDSVEDVDQEEDQLRTIREDAVQLLTFHGAKGLEWDCVFLAGIAKQVIPSEKPSESPAEKWWRVPFELRGDREFKKIRRQGAPGRRQGTLPPAECRPVRSACLMTAAHDAATAQEKRPRFRGLSR